MSHRNKKVVEVPQVIVQPAKLDIASQAPEQPGFLKLSRAAMLQFPWPVEPESIDEAISLYAFNHVPGLQRGDFMDELYRVMSPDGKATFVVPYWSSSRAIHDFRAEWPPLCEQSFLFFNAEWRKAQGLGPEYGTSDFDFTYGYAEEPETTTRNGETKAFWIKHYIGSVNDLHIVLSKRKK